jgi:Mrp family chromosome partitioning ATPase
MEEPSVVTNFYDAMNGQAHEPQAHGAVSAPLPPQTSPPEIRTLTLSERLARVITPSENVVPQALARLKAIHRITESFGGVASALGDARLAIAGCAAGDGCSSVAAAVALDLTQRLNVRTLLVDGNLCRPRVVKMFASRETAVLASESRTLVEVQSEQGIVVRSSNWAKLEVANVTPALEKNEPASLNELNDRVRAFPATVIDLGAVRVDPRALPLVRPNDPVLLVVRSGCTERSDLLATINLFSNIGRPVRGIILNATESAIPRWLRSLLGKGKEGW